MTVHIGYKKNKQVILAKNLREWHELGWTDPMIAKKVGCTKSLVCMMRKALHLPANAPPGSEDWRASLGSKMDSISSTMSLHSQGLTDTEAAKVIGCTRSAFMKRRLRLGLPCNREVHD